MSASLIAAALQQLGTLLTDLTPEDRSRSTPCTDWTLGDLSDHIVNSTAGMVTMTQGGEPDWSANPHHDDPAAALEEQGRALVDGLSADDAQFPVGMAAGELAVHTYDLATALGKDTADLDPEIAQLGYALMSTSLTDENRGGAFEPEQQAPDGADIYQRLAAFAGRSLDGPSRSVGSR